MTQRKNRYFACILITLLSVLFCSCSDNPVGNKEPVNPIAIVITPMWPQAGYNAQNTSSPYAPFAYCNPVNLGEVDWYYNFPEPYYSYAPEFCVDSRSNIYFISQEVPMHKLYKFRADGTVIWIIDSLNSPNYAFISLNSNESRIYFNSNNDMFCYDSSGHYIWSVPNIGAYPKPSVGKDGTIYTLINQKIAAVKPDGSIKWISTEQLPAMAVYFALDRDENIYTGGNKISKLNKNGITVWSIIPDSVPFITSGVVIDGFGNIYFTNYLTGNSMLYSLTKNGVLRWKAPSSGSSEPVISGDNRIYTVGLSLKCFDTTGLEIWSRPMPAGVYAGESPAIDDAGNLYFITDYPMKAVSFTGNGDQRWVVDIFNYNSLPRPSLMPMGRMLVAPKRAGKIACVK